MIRCNSPLKWAGGKRKLLDRIYEHIPGRCAMFVDVFTGSGVVGANAPAPYVHMYDLNTHLVSFLTHLRTDEDRLIERCEGLWEDGNNELHYYLCRNEFNSLVETEYNSLEKSALFYYLNKHCFNGLCRFNGDGKFNVPFGRYKAVDMNEEGLHQFSSKLKHCVIDTCDFRKVMSDARYLKSTTVMYCDPPYAPVTETSFTGYTGEFGKDCQEELADLARKAARKGVTVILSNSDTPFTRKLYADATLVEELSVGRSISSKGSTRKPAAELLVVYRRKK